MEWMPWATSLRARSGPAPASRRRPACLLQRHPTGSVAGRLRGVGFEVDERADGVQRCVLTDAVHRDATKPAAPSWSGSFAAQHGIGQVHGDA